MDSHIFICPKCRSAYGLKSEGPHQCSACNVTLIATNMTDPEWYSMPRDKRQTAIDQLVGTDNVYGAEFQKRQAQLAALAAAKENMILTTSHSVEGYRIVKYIDVYFEEIVAGFGLGKSVVASFDAFFSSLDGSESRKIRERLDQLKTMLKERVIEKAALDGADAIIAIDFEKSSVGDLLMLSMSGTAVKLEKII